MERNLSSASNPTENRGVIFMGPNDVEVKGIPFPTLELDSTSSPVESERQKVPTLLSSTQLPACV